MTRRWTWIITVLSVVAAESYPDEFKGTIAQVRLQGVLLVSQF